MKQVRIAITFDCNFTCHYCIMNKNEVRDTFKRSTIEDILNNIDQYSSIAITGGEPTLYQDTMEDICRRIKRVSDAPIYLYTNGSNLTDNFLTRFFGLIDGINWGAHQDNLSRKRILEVNGFIPIRIHRWSQMVTEDFRDWCKVNRIPLKEWEMDHCNTVEEDRYIIS